MQFLPPDYSSMKAACSAAVYVLDGITKYVCPGISTEELDIICSKLIAETGGRSACLNYNGFPKHVCISVNHAVCHGIPSITNILKNGDIVNIDVTVIINNHFGDTSRMYIVGKGSSVAEKLVQTTFEAMHKGIDVICPGIKTGVIAEAITKHCAMRGFSVVRDYGGHGIGRAFHMEPFISFYGTKDDGTILKEGMYITVEPMINVGSYKVSVLSDGWTVVTRDRSLSAQFEHTVFITSNGPEILTL